MKPVLGSRLESKGAWNPPVEHRETWGIAARTGKDPRQVVEEGIDRMLAYDERFLAAIEKGRSSSRRGDLVEHDEVVERVERDLTQGNSD